jgi:WD40 repeat protein
VVNFNLHGDMVPSSVSVVATEAMVEIARLTTCTMPHGSRLNALGSRQYSTCMMDDLLVESDAWDLSVGRHFMLAPGREHGMIGAPGGQQGHGAHGEHQGHGAPASSHLAHAMPPAECSPTWAQPSADGRTIFVACNRSDEIVEVWVEDWTLKRRFPAGEGVYNLAVTRDGSLLVGTNKRGGSVSIFDAVSGEELARIPTARSFVHGVVISPDDRYAFVSVEGVGSEPGTVEIIDLAERRMAARVDVPQMAGGITFWR